MILYYSALLIFKFAAKNRIPNDILNMNFSSIVSVGKTTVKPSSTSLETNLDIHDVGIVNKNEKKACSAIGVEAHNKFTAHFTDPLCNFWVLHVLELRQYIKEN